MDLHPWRSTRNKHISRPWLAVAAATAALLLFLCARRASVGQDPACKRGVGPHRSGAVFVLYTQEHFLLRQTVHSLLEAGWHGQVLLLDNSAGHDAAADAGLCRGGVEVLRTSGSLNFAQLQNVAASIALERGLEFYFIAHPGVLVLGPGPDTSFRAAAMQCVERVRTSAPDWGLAFFGSDRFAAVRAKAAADVHWDVFIPSYRADCDFYQSLKVSGWSLQQCATGRVVTAWQELDVPYGNHTAAAAVLEEHARAAAGEGQAARAAQAKALPPEAKVAWAMQMRTSVEYYEYKWRTHDCDMADDRLPWQAE